MTGQDIMAARLAGSRLVNPEKDVNLLLKELCGVQAQYFSNAEHSVFIRSGVRNGDFSDFAVKTWTLRGTAHLVSREDLPLYMGKDCRSTDFSKESFWNTRDYWSLSPERQEYFSGLIIDALERKIMSREELKTLCREKGMTPEEENCMFHPWGGGIRELCERGFIAYVPCEKKLFCALGEYRPVEDALRVLAERYFRAYGPAKLTDAARFLGTTVAKVKAAVSESELCECGGMYYAGSVLPSGGDIPPVLFLAGFDPIMLGVAKENNPFLPEEHLRGIFTLSGTVNPAVVLHGRTVGRWKKKGKSLNVGLFEDITRADERLTLKSAEALWQEELSLSCERL